MMGISIKRQERYKRHVTAWKKGTPHGKCIRQERYLSGLDKWGRPQYRVRYLHVTKGWRDRCA